MLTSAVLAAHANLKTYKSDYTHSTFLTILCAKTVSPAVKTCSVGILLQSRIVKSNPGSGTQFNVFLALHVPIHLDLELVTRNLSLFSKGKGRGFSQGMDPSCG